MQRSEQVAIVLRNERVAGDERKCNRVTVLLQLRPKQETIPNMQIAKALRLDSHTSTAHHQIATGVHLSRFQAVNTKGTTRQSLNCNHER